MLTGERAEMSRRVMRRLPRTSFGRVFGTWLIPGPYSGYMFAVANLLSVALMCIFAAWVNAARGSGTAIWLGMSDFLFAIIIGVAYVIAYLGVGRLVIAALRRVSE